MSHRIEPRVGGRLLEVYDDDVWELGRVLAWEPPTRLAFSWRQSNWEPHETTTVEIRFVPDGDGTRVDLEHTGWEGVQSQVGCELGYQKGWCMLLGWFGEAGGGQALPQGPPPDAAARSERLSSRPGRAGLPSPDQLSSASSISRSSSAKPAFQASACSTS